MDARTSQRLASRASAHGGVPVGCVAVHQRFAQQFRRTMDSCLGRVRITQVDRLPCAAADTSGDREAGDASLGADAPSSRLAGDAEDTGGTGDKGDTGGKGEGKEGASGGAAGSEGTEGAGAVNNNNNKKATKKNSRTNSRKKDKGAGILVFHLPPFAAAVFEAALSHDGPALPAPLSACMRDTSARYFSGVRPADALFGRALLGGGGVASNSAASSSASSPSTPSSTSSPSAFTFAEIFAGIGGFRLGLEALGGRCVLSSEIDAPARRTYAANFPTTRDARDARDAATAPRAATAAAAAAAADVGGSAGGGVGAAAVGDVGSGMGGCLQVGSVVSVYAEDVPDFDLLTAGFPCQSFSTRGAQKGLGEERGKPAIRQRRKCVCVCVCVCV